MRIAVVGAGIAGLGAAWLLAQRFDVTVFEAAPQAGGHAHTVDAATPDGPVAVDTGFIVYNEENYPNLTRLFRTLAVATAASDMSFAVSIGRPDSDRRLEYAGRLSGLFAQPSNALSPSYWRMLADLRRFYREAPQLLASAADPGESLGGLLKRGGYGRAFVEHHLLPMAAAIWSTPPERMLDFPAVTLLRFFENHGLFRLRGRPEWRTVAGGSRQYVDAITAPLGERLHTATPVRALRRTGAGVRILTDRGEVWFDHVVLATHADQALAVLGEDASAAERGVLGAFGYEMNHAVLHRDPRLMPRHRRVWSSWNYMAEAGNAPAGGDVSVTYWMNRLQPLGDAPDVFVSLNPQCEPDPSLTLARFQYAHPRFEAATIGAQQRLSMVQGVRRTWFCGSYCGYGFHEDALTSGLRVAAAFGLEAPWAAEVPRLSPAGAMVDPLVPLVAAE